MRIILSMNEFRLKNFKKINLCIFLAIFFISIFLFLSTKNIFAETVEDSDLILHMDFSSIEDLTGNQTVSLTGTDHTVNGGACGVGNKCYNVGYFDNVIDLGSPLLTDNVNWTMAFDGYIPTGSTGYVSFVSQYTAGSVGRFFLGKSTTQKKGFRIGNVTHFSTSDFTTWDQWQHWVISKSGNTYTLTIDGELTYTTTTADTIQSNTNTVVGLFDVSLATGYIDNLFIFNEAYSYNDTRNFIDNYEITSNTKSITNFSFDALSVDGVIDEQSITLSVPFGTDVTNLVPTISFLGDSISPLSGVANDFSSPQTYTVTAEDDSTIEYTITVNILPEEIEDSDLILHMDFSSIEDLTGNQTVSLTGADYTLDGGLCGSDNKCYNVGYTDNGIDLGSPLLTDNTNWTIAFDGYIPSASTAKYVPFISQYTASTEGRFYVGKDLADKKGFKIGAANNFSTSTFTTWGQWQHWVISKSSNTYTLTIDGELAHTVTIADAIQSSVNTEIGLLNTVINSNGYIDNLFIFNEAYPYTNTRNFIDNYESVTVASVSLDSPSNYQIYQRDNDDNATITISGNVTGVSEPVDIEMSYKGSSWSVIATNVTSDFSYDLISGVGMGELIVRIASDTEKTASKTVGVGDLYLLIGQSNQDGRANTKNNVVPQEGVYGSMFQQSDRCTYYITSNSVSGGWKVNNDPTGNGNSGGCYDYGSQWPIVSSHLIEEYGVPIGWITGTYGGTSVSVWQKGQVHYDRAITLVNQATGGSNRIKGVLWHQGEADSSQTKEWYYTRLNSMITSLQEDLQFEKILVAIVSIYGGSNGAGVQEAQHQIVDDLEVAHLGPESYDISVSVDNLHYKTDAEIAELSRRWFKHIEKEFYEADFDYPELLQYEKNSDDTILVKANQELEISDFLFNSGSKADGFKIINNGDTVSDYTTSLIEDNGEHFVLIDVGEEINLDSFSLTYAEKNSGYNTDVLRSKESKLSVSRNYEIPLYLDETSPVISSVFSISSSTSAVISWTTDEPASSIIDYGFNSSYTTSTVEINTDTRVTSHTVNLSNLLPCATYHYRVKSKDNALNLATSIDNSFTTTGCTGDALIEEAISDTVATSTGSVINLNSGTANITINVPAGFDVDGETDVNFQINQLATSALILATGNPSGKSIVGSHTYDVSAFSDVVTALTSFDQPITITITYLDSELGNLEESSLNIYYWDGDSWEALNSCLVNPSVNTVTCTTNHFTTFGVFGSVATVINSMSSGGGMVMPADWGNVPIVPMGGFKVNVNSGLNTTTDRIVTLNLNAGSDVKKMAISMTGDFTDASQEPYVNSKQWDLCSKFGGVVKDGTCPDGQYNIYVKFFTHYGQASDIVTTKINLATTSQAIKPSIVFTKDLRLGSKDNQVKILQQFLNQNGFHLATIGVGSIGKETDYFGRLTSVAITKLQEANKSKIPTLVNERGYLGSITREFINSLANMMTSILAPTQQTQKPASIIFTTSLYKNIQSEDVSRLQKLLATNPEIYPEGLVTGYFGSLTEKAVQTFQLKYNIVTSKADPGFGVVGPKTREKLQEIFGK